MTLSFTALNCYLSIENDFMFDKKNMILNITWQKDIPY